MPDDTAPAAALAAMGALTCGADVGRAASRCGGRLNAGCGVSLRRGLWRGLRLGNWSALEEVFTQGSFKIGYKLAHGFSFRHAEGSGSGVSDRLKFGFSVGRGMLDCGLRFVRDGSGKEIIAQGRF